MLLFLDILMRKELKQENVQFCENGPYGDKQQAIEQFFSAHYPKRS